MTLLRCRNYVTLLTDGGPNGPSDSTGTGFATDCGSAACAADDPGAAGCQCRSVLASKSLKTDLDASTLVLGFADSAIDRPPRRKRWRISPRQATARPSLRGNERNLNRAFKKTVLEAAKQSYSTSPATSSAGGVGDGEFLSGRYALETRFDYPSWKGHLLAYDMAAQPPELAER